MLELLRGKRLVFVGDSLNRNMWESLICILRNSVKDQKKVYEEFGRHHFKAEASYSFVFEVSSKKNPWFPSSMEFIHVDFDSFLKLLCDHYRITSSQWSSLWLHFWFKNGR